MDKTVRNYVVFFVGLITILMIGVYFNVMRLMALLISALLVLLFFIGLGSGCSKKETFGEMLTKSIRFSIFLTGLLLVMSLILAGIATLAISIGLL